MVFTSAPPPAPYLRAHFWGARFFRTLLGDGLRHSLDVQGFSALYCRTSKGVFRRKALFCKNKLGFFVIALLSCNRWGRLDCQYVGVV